MATKVREQVYESVALQNAGGDIVLHAHPPKDSCLMCAQNVPVCTSMRRVITDEQHIQVYADGVLFVEYDLD